MQKNKKTTALVWFRTDLRVQDQHSLTKAVQQHERVVAVYHIPKKWLEFTRWGFKKMERFRANFLLQSLEQLKKDLEQLNISLIVTTGNWTESITRLQKKYSITDIYAQYEWTQEEVDEQNTIPNNVKTHLHYDQFLYHPENIPMAVNQIPEVFTVFRKTCEKQVVVQPPIPIPEAMPTENLIADNPDIPTLNDLGYEEIHQDSRTAIPFVGGEKAAWTRIDEYFWDTKQLSYYKKTRNGLLGKKYSSKLSLWLAYGSISPRSIYAEIKKYEREIGKNESTYWLIFELIWRDYFKFISLKHGNSIFRLGGILNKDYTWDTNPRKIEKWMTGNTPEPFVNANMLELANTGFMSNRGRQNVASFFAKEWKLDWRIGAAYFESMLIDYDVHSNYGNWMYNAGVGNDPRDRKFNIAWQAERYDASGKYQNTWLQKTLF